MPGGRSPLEERLSADVHLVNKPMCDRTGMIYTKLDNDEFDRGGHASGVMVQRGRRHELAANRAE